MAPHVGLFSIARLRTTLYAMVFLSAFAGARDSLHQAFCSPDNTGSDYGTVTSIYQSNGACFDQCKDDYAFAVVQYQSCWCSNYIPANQQSTSDCNQDCPGYPKEQCGNENSGVFGYVPLRRPPSGTAGAPSSTAAPTSEAPSTTAQPSSTAAPPTSSSEPETSYTPTPSPTPAPASTSSPSPSPSDASSTTIPVVAPLPSPTDTLTLLSVTPSPVTSLRVVTISGAAVTQTVTSTPMVAPPNSSDSTKLHRTGLSGGAIAGIVIGALIGLAAVLLAIFLLWRRKNSGDTEGGSARPKRTTSVLSKSGLLSRARPQSMAEHEVYEDNAYANAGTGNNSVRHSMLFGAGAGAMNGEGVSPVSPLGSSHDNSSSRRHSRPLVYDQRLNPSALFANTEGNSSRVSMQDQQDYSRPLGIANPDTRASFDSRISR